MTHHFVPPALLAEVLFWLAALACAVAHLGILRSLLRATPRRLIDFTWAVIPALVLAAVLIVTGRRMHVSA